MSLDNLINKNKKTRIGKCSRHGDYTSTNFIGEHWTDCPSCVAIKREKIEKQEEEKYRAQAKERANRKWLGKIKGAAIPDRFKDRTLDSYIAKTTGQKKALAFAKEYAENFDQVLKTGRSAIFVGKVGTGKTHLAIGIALSIMQQQRSPLFVTVQRLIRRVKDSWHTKTETESEVVDAFASPDLLILDEVGVQFGSEFEKQLLFDVLNERYEKLKPSILLSNIPTDQLNDYLGERVTDRLRENGGKMIGFDWESYRKNL
tara:strand:+ start:1655 stop:2431 length:777 start_codon:yes stop_codon:yes gene_type:complete